MVDQYKIIEKLSALESKILAKYTEEELEKLCETLKELDIPWVQFALMSSSKEFPLKEILSHEGFSDDEERYVLFFQWIVLSLILEVFRAAENLYPGISEFEMLHLAGKRIKEKTFYSL